MTGEMSQQLIAPSVPSEDLSLVPSTELVYQLYQLPVSPAQMDLTHLI